VAVPYPPLFPLDGLVRFDRFHSTRRSLLSLRKELASFTGKFGDQLA